MYIYIFFKYFTSSFLFFFLLNFDWVFFAFDFFLSFFFLILLFRLSVSLYILFILLFDSRSNKDAM